VVAPLEMKEGTTLGARAQSAIQRAAVLYKPRLETFFPAEVGFKICAYVHILLVDCYELVIDGK
jgi:hypothetical protein